jgi:hypothetical protein
MSLADIQSMKALKIAKQNNASLKQIMTTPIGFRDTSSLFNSRDNVNQTGTTRLCLFPQFDCQDIVLVYSNVYENSASTIVPNTNSISIKASLDVRGNLFPVFFNGKRTVTIEGGATVYSDPIGCMITPIDPVFVRTYFDSGTGGYIPRNAFLRTFNANLSVLDGITFGSDLTDSGSVTATASSVGFVPRAILGTANVQKSFLLVGDSILDGTGDVVEASNGNTGFVARRFFTDKISSTKISCPGETAFAFLNNLNCRTPLVKNYTDVICNYGTNDLTYYTLSQIQTSLLKIWKYFATKGMRIYQTTITPKTDSTDNWLTLTNQTVRSSESIRLGLNAWLRDYSSNGAVAQSGGNLFKVLDTAVIVEDSVTGKWKVPSARSYSGTVQSAGTNYINDTNLTFTPRALDSNGVIKITGGTGVGQILQIDNNAYGSPAGKQIVTKTNWSVIPDSTSTYEIWITPTLDSTHPTPSYHQLMSQAVNV